MTTPDARTTSTTPLAQPTPDQPAFVLTRILDAPHELVFKAFTEPERLMH